MRRRVRSKRGHPQGSRRVLRRLPAAGARLATATATRRDRALTTWSLLGLGPQGALARRVVRCRSLSMRAAARTAASSTQQAALAGLWLTMCMHQQAPPRHQLQHRVGSSSRKRRRRSRKRRRSKRRQ